MLSLERPPIEIDETLLYGDHAVATHFYYAAPNPRIARTGGRAMFDVFSYSVELEHSPLAGTTIPEELGAGFLTMGVECALPDAAEANLRRELATRTGVAEDQVTLGPIPYHKGSVSVLALDAFSRPTDPNANAGSPDALKGRPTFVESVLGSGAPNLLGDLRTIFSLSLSRDGVTFMEGLLEDGAAPVGVIFDLRFHGLRPAVEAVVTADMSRISRHFGAGAGVQYGWFKADVEAAIDHLEEQGAVRVELTTQAVGEEAQRSRELALSMFKEQIVQQLFRPTATVPAVTTPSVPGLPQAAGVNLTLRVREADERREVRYDFRERSPEERTHAPQGFIPLLLSPRELAERLHRVPLDSDFFEILEVLVTGPSDADFGALGIRQVEATLTYGRPGDPAPPESRTLLFRAGSTGDKVFAVKRRGRPSLAYDMALTYEFERAAGVDADDARYELPATTRTGRVQAINPLADFGVLDVEVELGRVDPTIDEVDVALGYRSADGRFEAAEGMRLAVSDAGGAPRRWQVRTLETDLAPYTVTATYSFTDGAVYTAPPFTATDALCVVDDPFPALRELRLQPNVTSAAVMELGIELAYDDPAGGYSRRFEETIARAPDGTFPSRVVRWPILAVDRRRVRYRVTTRESGFVTAGDWQETDEPSIVVGSVGSRSASVDVRLVGPALGEVGLDAVQVRLTLALNGADGDVHNLLFDPGQTMQTVKLTLPPGTSLKYRYQTVAFKSDGRVVGSPWKELAEALLVIPTRSLASA